MIDFLVPYILHREGKQKCLQTRASKFPTFFNSREAGIKNRIPGNSRAIKNDFNAFFLILLNLLLLLFTILLLLLLLVYY